MIDVSIITINYHSLDDTRELIEHINRGETSDLSYEIIVVDNSSHDHESTILAKCRNTRVIYSKTNLGFAGGNNLGYLHARGHYLFFVNNDCLLGLATVKSLISAFKQNPEYGMLCPIIKNSNKTIQFAGYTRVHPLTARNRTVTHIETEEEILETAYPHGAAMFTSQSVIKETGLMKEHYFLYYEELDWGSEIREKGYQIGVHTSSEIIHKESVSVGKISNLKLYFITRNRLLFVRLQFPFFRRLAFYSYFLFIGIPKNTLQYLLNRDWKNVATFISAIGWHLTNSKYSQKLGAGFDRLRIG